MAKRIIRAYVFKNDAGIYHPGIVVPEGGIYHLYGWDTERAVRERLLDKFEKNHPVKNFKEAEKLVREVVHNAYEPSKPGDTLEIVVEET